MIKDNTISELKNEYGLRSSIAGLTTKQEDTRDIGSLAQPDTKDVKCQTHGPRKQAYYRSIPAKVQTNLPTRSPSAGGSQERSHDCSNEQNHGSGSQNIPLRYNSYQRNSKISSSFANTNGARGCSPGKSQNHAISNSYSPSRRRLSPPKGGDGIGSQTNDDIRSLRL